MIDSRLLYWTLDEVLGNFSAIDCSLYSGVSCFFFIIVSIGIYCTQPEILSIRLKNKNILFVLAKFQFRLPPIHVYIIPLEFVFTQIWMISKVITLRIGAICGQTSRLAFGKWAILNYTAESKSIEILCVFRMTNQAFGFFLFTLWTILNI